MLAYNVKLALQSHLKDCLSNSSLDLIGLAQELRVSGLELIDDHSIPLKALEKIKRRLEAAALEPVSLHIPCRFSDPSISQDTAFKTATVGLQRAVLLGCKTICLRPSPPVGILVEQERAAFSQGIARLMPEIKRLGLRPTLNNGGKHAAYYGQVEYIQKLCQDFAPEVHVTFDIGNWLLANESPLQAAQLLAPWIAVVHLKDWQVLPSPSGLILRKNPNILNLVLQIVPWGIRNPLRKLKQKFRLLRFPSQPIRGLDGTHYVGTVIGNGILEHESFLRFLQSISYSGFLCVEYEGDQDLRIAFRQAVENVRALFAKIEESS